MICYNGPAVNYTTNCTLFGVSNSTKDKISVSYEPNTVNTNLSMDKGNSNQFIISIVSSINAHYNFKL